MNATRWLVKMGSTQDGMVWFDGKKLNPNDAREVAKALDFLALSAFAQKPHSIDVPVLIARITEKKPE